MSTVQSVGATDPLSTPAVGPGAPVAEARRGTGSDLLRAIMRSKKALVGLLILLFFLVLAIFPGLGNDRAV